MAALRMADGRINNFITNLNDIVYDMRAFIILIVNIIYLNTCDMRVLGTAVLLFYSINNNIINKITCDISALRMAVSSAPFNIEFISFTLSSTAASRSC